MQPKKMGCVQHREHIDWNNKIVIFTHMYYSSVMSDLNGTKFILEVPSTQEKLQTKFKENSLRRS